MAKASIPVDAWNPGQVLACLGLHEAASWWAGPTESQFDWSDPVHVRFELNTSGVHHPVEFVLDSLCQVHLSVVRPAKPTNVEDGEDAPEDGAVAELSDTFPAKKPDKMALPVRLGSGLRELDLTHWADGTRRDAFKLYAGNRTAFGIASAMLHGVRKSPKRNQQQGDIVRQGVSQLWKGQRAAMMADPFGVVTPLGGSFNFDARRAWTAIDAGYSPNQHKNPVMASPLVEILCAWGLESSRPTELSTRYYRYSLWGEFLDVNLARVALPGCLRHIPQRTFNFELAMSGKDKVINYAEEQTKS